MLAKRIIHGTRSKQTDPQLRLEKTFRQSLVKRSLRKLDLCHASKAEETTRGQKQKSRRSFATMLPRDCCKMLQASEPATGSGKYLSQYTHAAQPYEYAQMKLPRLPAFRIYRANPETPDGFFHFGRLVKLITNSLPNTRMSRHQTYGLLL